MGENWDKPHNDIKLENIIWCPHKAKAYLFDFGLAGFRIGGTHLTWSPMQLNVEWISTQKNSDAMNMWGLILTIAQLINVKYNYFMTGGKMHNPMFFHREHPYGIVDALQRNADISENIVNFFDEIINIGYDNGLRMHWIEEHDTQKMKTDFAHWKWELLH